MSETPPAPAPAPPAAPAAQPPHEGLLERFADHLPGHGAGITPPAAQPGPIPPALRSDIKLHAADVFDVADLVLQVTEAVDPSVAGVDELVTKTLALARNAARIAGQVHATA
jgi:hypothetical protein